MLYVGEGSEREQWRLLHSLLVFSHFLHYPQSNWAVLMLIPMWVGLCTVKDPVGLSSGLSCEAGSFSHCRLSPHRCFQSEVWGFISPNWSPGLWVCLAPQLFLPVYLLVNVGPPGPPADTSQWVLAPCCLSPPLLPVWVSVSSLSPWSSDFHTVGFSVSSGWFLFLNCCCPSFGCGRRHSVSTYAPILAKSPTNT